MIEDEGDGDAREFAVGAWGEGDGKDAGRGVKRAGSGGGGRRVQPRGTWTEESMKEAIKEVKKGTSSIGKIGEKYGIPESSIRDWLTGKTSSKKKGPRTVLSKEEEEAMVDWCMDMQRNGHAITFYMLRRKVADICQGRETPFRNGVPGKSWMDWFRKRHPTVMIEAAHSLKGKKRTDTPRGRGLLDGLIAREEDDGTKRDLFGASGSDPSPMESHDTRDIVLQLIQHEPHMEAQLSNQMQGPMSAEMQNHLASHMASQLNAPPRSMDAPHQEESTPAYDTWRGQNRGNHDHECHEDAGATSFNSEDSGSFPSSDDGPGGSRWLEFMDGMVSLERTIRESEDRKDRRLERQLEANERIAASLIGALSQVSDCLRSINSRSMSAELGVAVSALGNLGGSIAGLTANLAEQQQQ